MEIKFALVVEFHFGIPDSEEVRSTVIDTDSDQDVLTGLIQTIRSMGEPYSHRFELERLESLDSLQGLKDDSSILFDNHIMDYHVVPVLQHGDRQFTLSEFNAEEYLRSRE